MDGWIDDDGSEMMMMMMRTFGRQYKEDMVFSFVDRFSIGREEWYST